ncbi:hypothetical protein BGX34_001185 [Mortierella sp. NVP85]|nr:hypothetical protein BGX34_001185 [Mortierella sp. NVP85]
MASQPFDDFLELGMFDASTNMLSLLFNTDDLSLPSAAVAASAVPALDMDMILDPLAPLDISSPTPLETSTTTDLEIPSVAADPLPSPVNDGTKQDEQRDIQLLLAINRHFQQQQQEDAHSPVKDSTDLIPGMDNSALIAQLIKPASISVTPQALMETTPQSTLTVSPTTTFDISSTLITTATSDAQTINSSKAAIASASIPAATTATKRPSPEPAPAARKIARTEATTATAKAASNVSASVATPTDTTLSPATLQFLLQQQTQTPSVPQLFTKKLSRKEIEETLTRLLEATRYLLMASHEAVDDNEDSPIAESEEGESDEAKLDEQKDEQSAGQTHHGLKTQPGIKTDDIPSSTDLKKMTSKERRQLRNKISARNFRVRRKEYIGQLEGQVEQHKTEAQHLREAVVVVYEENKRLKEELEEVKRQLTHSTAVNDSVTIAPQQSIASPATTLSYEDQSLLASILTRTAFNSNVKNNPVLTVPRPQSPIPCLNKDVPNSSSLNAKSWRDKKPVLVHTAHIPEIFIGEQLQFGPKPSWSKEDDMWDRPWLDVERTPKELSKMETNPFLLSGIVYELMQTCASMTLSLTTPQSGTESLSRAIASVHGDSKATAQDYENDRRVDETNEWQMQYDLCKFVQAMTPVQIDMDKSEIPDEVFSMLFNGESSVFPFSPLSPPFSASGPGSPGVDIPLLEWLHHSMMMDLVNQDLQCVRDRVTYLPCFETRFA